MRESERDEIVEIERQMVRREREERRESTFRRSETRLAAERRARRRRPLYPCIPYQIRIRESNFIILVTNDYERVESLTCEHDRNVKSLTELGRDVCDNAHVEFLRELLISELDFGDHLDDGVLEVLGAKIDAAVSVRIGGVLDAEAKRSEAVRVELFELLDHTLTHSQHNLGKVVYGVERTVGGNGVTKGCGVSRLVQAGFREGE